MSVSLQHILEPSVRHAKRKFSFTSKPMSISASLCKHLTKAKKEDNAHGLEKDMQGEKRKGRENEENHGRRKKFFGKSKVVKSAEDRLHAYLPTKEGNDEHEQVSSTLPLHTGHDWYVERRRNESKNRAQLQSRTRTFFNASKGTARGGSCDEAIKRKNSMEIYETLSRHLNLLQVYIQGKAFLIENRSSPLIEVVSKLKNIFDSFDFRAQLNSHIEGKIGDCYKKDLAFLDTKRDRDTV